MKMSQIVTENDKNLKLFQFSKISCIFFQIFHGSRELEQRKGLTRKECVVRKAFLVKVSTDFVD